ncbi:MAG: heavy-metal-associated domain-containing protein [Proteobacteria bacterium]|nr:heavy-metal-associated domain-containing protein [Pseudomonadota bacterium]
MRKCLAAAFLAAALAWPAAAHAGSHAYRLYVDGLACPFCAYGVEKNILGLKGVEKLDIDMEGGFVTVVMEGGKALDERLAKKAVADAGFTLRSFEVRQGK